jgi:hypothetical protein
MLCPPAPPRQAAQPPVAAGRKARPHRLARLLFVPYGPEDLARYGRPDRLPQRPGTARLTDERGSPDLP